MSFFSSLPVFLLLIAICVSVEISPEQLQQDLNDCISNESCSSFEIASGEYHFINTNFYINNAQDFVITSSADTIFYLNCTKQISINNCSNVSISNFVIDFDPPCFSQGIINEIDTSALTLTITVDKGYPLPDKSINSIFSANVVKVIYWDNTSKEMIHNQSVVNKWNGSLPLNNAYPYKYKIFLQQMNTIPTVNDAVTIGPRTGNTFFSNNCGNLKVTNLTLYSSGNMAVVEVYGYGNNTYDNYRLIRRPNSGHLLTSTADGFHSNCNMYGPTLRNSYLEFPGDDFANVHNRMNILMTRIDDNSLYIIDTLNGETLKRVSNNDYIYFYELNSQKYLGYGLVNRCVKQNNQTLTNEAKGTYETLQNPPYNAGFVVDYRGTVEVYLVSFSNQLSVNIKEYNLVEFDLNNGALFENNHFHTGYVTLIKLKSKGSIVRNNLFEYGKGIHISAEQNWLEGELGLQNIIIENNIFKNCGSNTTAITVQGNAVNITIVNNTIS